MTFAPAIPEPWPLIAGIALPVIGLLLAWRASRPLGLWSRASLSLLRGGVFGGLALLLLNPGRWKQPEHEDVRVHAVLLDHSASMAIRDAGDETRWTRGQHIVQQLTKAGGDKVKTFAFAAGVEGDALRPEVKPDGQESAIVRSGIGLFSGAAGLGQKLASVVIVSDGRQTREDPAAELVLRARAADVPVHVVPLGTDWGGRDLIVRVTRRLIMALPGKPVSVGTNIENKGLGKIKPRVQLLDDSGKVLATRDIELDSGMKKLTSIDVPKLAAGEYRVVVSAQQGEDIVSNNEDRFRVRELAGRTRVFIAEGAPYWDSKFLAQLLREQGFMDVRAVYRLNAERYFRVDGGASEPVASGESTFPEKPEDFAKLDLVVLGKGAEGFLDDNRIAGLKSFVRDRGGALLMARGKAYAGRLQGLESVEPVEWGAQQEGTYRFEPGSVGEAAGLFGQVLPEMNDPLWRQLPMLKDVSSIVRLKPFAQVLAMGIKPGASHDERVPLLVARHFGRGVVVALNADGLWQWDFDPQARKLGNLYEEFWTQLLQWTASYAEFLPGQELSLRLSDGTIKQGHGTRASIGWRGGDKAPAPTVRVFKGKDMVLEVAAGEGETDSEGRRSWTALVQPEQPGTYQVQVFNNSAPGPEAVLHVLAPPTEQESLAADPEFLRSLAESTGGKVWAADAGEALAKQLFDTPPSMAKQAAKAEWQPLWPRGWVLGALVGMMGVEWWARRRKGLL